MARPTLIETLSSEFGTVEIFQQVRSGKYLVKATLATSTRQGTIRKYSRSHSIARHTALFLARARVWDVDLEIIAQQIRNEEGRA
jgi:hypothetical protein